MEQSGGAGGCIFSGKVTNCSVQVWMGHAHWAYVWIVLFSGFTQVWMTFHKRNLEQILKILYTITRSIWKMLGPFTTASRLSPIHQMSLAVLLRAACASMSTTTTTTRDRGDRYGPMEWAQWSCVFNCRLSLVWRHFWISFNYSYMMIDSSFIIITYLLLTVIINFHVHTQLLRQR